MLSENNTLKPSVKLITYAVLMNRADHNQTAQNAHSDPWYILSYFQRRHGKPAIIFLQI